MSPPVARMVRLCWPAAIRPRRDATTNTCTAAVRRVGGPGSGRERIGGKLGAGRAATKETAGKGGGAAVNGQRSTVNGTNPASGDLRGGAVTVDRSEEHTSELQSLAYLV